MIKKLFLFFFIFTGFLFTNSNLYCQIQSDDDQELSEPESGCENHHKESEKQTLPPHVNFIKERLGSLTIITFLGAPYYYLSLDQNVSR